MLAGKGMYVWQIRNCEGGDIKKIARLAVEARLQHVLIKVADSATPFNVTSGGRDLAYELTQALKAKGISVWGWHYIYGYYPVLEAQVALRRIEKLGLEGYVLDVEKEFKRPQAREAAKQFFKRFYAGGTVNIPVALSSYRYPELHREIPWDIFLSNCQVNIPQVYWMGSTNAGEQLRECADQFNKITQLPMIPTGAAFTERGWSAKPAEITDFLRTAKSMGFSGANFWEWSHARAAPSSWKVISDFDWGEPVEPEPVPEPNANKVTVNTNILNVRMGPSIATGRKIGQIRRGDDLDVFDRATDEYGNTWAYVGMWVAEKYGSRELLIPQ